MQPIPATRDAAPEAETLRLRDRGDDLFRLAGLSDALFAIVLTLLVLELKLPEAAHALGDAALAQAFAKLWPKLLAYLLTFLVAGLYWVAHHWSLAQIARYDRRLLWLNLSFLLSVSLLPFSTSLLGEGPSALGWRLYAGNVALAGLGLSALWGYARSQALLRPELAPRLARYALSRSFIAPGAFALSLLASFASPLLAYLTPLLIVPAQLAAHHLAFGTRADHGGQHQPLEAALWRLLGWGPVLAFVAWSLWRWLA